MSGRGSINQICNLSTGHVHLHLPIYLPIYLSTYLSVCWFVYLSVLSHLILSGLILYLIWSYLILFCHIISYLILSNLCLCVFKSDGQRKGPEVNLKDPKNWIVQYSNVIRYKYHTYTYIICTHMKYNSFVESLHQFLSDKNKRIPEVDHDEGIFALTLKNWRIGLFFRPLIEGIMGMCQEKQREMTGLKSFIKPPFCHWKISKAFPGILQSVGGVPRFLRDLELIFWLYQISSWEAMDQLLMCFFSNWKHFCSVSPLFCRTFGGGGVDFWLVWGCVITPAYSCHLLPTQVIALGLQSTWRILVRTFQDSCNVFCPTTPKNQHSFLLKQSLILINFMTNSKITISFWGSQNKQFAPGRTDLLGGWGRSLVGLALGQRGGTAPPRRAPGHAAGTLGARLWTGHGKNQIRTSKRYHHP